MDEILKELVQIRQELQNIRLILEYAHVPRYRVERRKVDGKTVRIRHTLEDPLEELRKGLHTGR